MFIDNLCCKLTNIEEKNDQHGWYNKELKKQIISSCEHISVWYKCEKQIIILAHSIVIHKLAVAYSDYFEEAKIGYRLFGFSLLDYEKNMKYFEYFNKGELGVDEIAIIPNEITIAIL